jgi:fatty-acyl-CoA synthase/long-chain acyl-CoA synthetase
MAGPKKASHSRSPSRKNSKAPARAAPQPSDAAQSADAGQSSGEDLARLRIAVTTMGDLLLTAADRYPDTPALVFPDSQYTYRELAARALLRARSLQALGVKPRDHVGILMHTCPAFVEIFFAAALCGAVVVPINARYRSNELAYVIENGDIATLVTTDAIAEQVSFVERLSGALPGLKSPVRRLCAASCSWAVR